MNEQSYLHGTHPSEQERLEIQARLLGGASFLPPMRPGHRILEVGCGTGAIAREVAAWVAPGEVVGIDRSPAQLRSARELAAEAGLTNLRFLEGDATHLPLPDGQLDGAYCRFVLEHVKDPVAAVREMSRVVRPGGGFVCAYEWQNGAFGVFPECPAMRSVWEAVYRLQAEDGGDAAVAMKLYGVFMEAGLRNVQLDAHAHTFTAQGGRLRAYVQGALEILGQTREPMLARGLTTQAELESAAGEYTALLERTGACIVEVMCCATGWAA